MLAVFDAANREAEVLGGGGAADAAGGVNDSSAPAGSSQGGAPDIGPFVQPAVASVAHPVAGRYRVKAGFAEFFPVAKTVLIPQLIVAG